MFPLTKSIPGAIQRFGYAELYPFLGANAPTNSMTCVRATTTKRLASLRRRAVGVKNLKMEEPFASPLGGTLRLDLLGAHDDHASADRRREQMDFVVTEHQSLPRLLANSRMMRF